MLHLSSKTLRTAVLFLMFGLCACAAFGQSKAEKSKVVGTVQGKPITEGELEKAAAKDLDEWETQRMQFEANYARGRQQALETALESVIEDRVLTAEAAKRGISKQDLLVKEVDNKVKETTPADVSGYYEANKSRIGRPLDSSLSAQILQYLKKENAKEARAAFLDRLKRDYAVTETLQPLRMNVDAPGSPSRGPENAPVTLVVFSDFQCPFCASVNNTLQQVLAKYGKQVRLVYRNFPLSQIHPDAERAAEASLCAAEQGRFWEMHDLLLAQQGQLKENDLKAKAAQVKLDTAAFAACLSSGRTADKVKRDQMDGYRAGVTGTPAMFINGRFLSGAVPLADIAKIIDEELHGKPGRVASARK